MADEPQVSMRVQRILAAANDEAALLNHEYLRTEHVVLGLLEEGKSIAAQVLWSLGVRLDSFRVEVFGSWAHHRAD